MQRSEPCRLSPQLIGQRVASDKPRPRARSAPALLLQLVYPYSVLYEDCRELYIDVIGVSVQIKGRLPLPFSTFLGRDYFAYKMLVILSRTADLFPVRDFMCHTACASLKFETGCLNVKSERMSNS